MVGKRGCDIDFATRLQIYAVAKRGDSYYRISKDLGVDKETAKRWGSPAAIQEIEKSGSVLSKRIGVVGPKAKFDSEEAKMLMTELEKKHMTQTKLAKKVGVTRTTIRNHTRFDSKTNPDGCFPYAPRQMPKLTPRIQEQRYAFSKESPIGKTARGSESNWRRKRKKIGFVDHSPASMPGTVNRSHRPNWKKKSTKKRDGLEADETGKKMAAKHQCFTAVCWAGKKMHCHSKRRRKKRKGLHIKPCYRLEKPKINTPQVVEVIRNVLGPFFKDAGVTVIFADNDKKLQKKSATEEWKKFGIRAVSVSW